MNATNPLRHGLIWPDSPESRALAAARLHAGGTVALPTETVYGLAANAADAGAVAGIYRAKGRPSFNPLIVHVPNREAAARVAALDDRAEALAAAFWPGALTMVVPRRDDAPLAGAVTAGLDTVALRCPAHPVMQGVLRESGLLLAAPSANRSGGISPTSADHVARSLGENAGMILDGGACAAGIESTIVGLFAGGWRVLRPGPVTVAALTAVLGDAPMDAPAQEGVIAPGQLASHYAPDTPVRLHCTTRPDGAYWIGFGDIAGDETLSAQGDLAEAAARLYDALHRADQSGAALIAVAPIPDEGMGAAINDRLARAASDRG